MYAVIGSDAFSGGGAGGSGGGLPSSSSLLPPAHALQGTDLDCWLHLPAPRDLPLDSQLSPLSTDRTRMLLLQ